MILQKIQKNRACPAKLQRSGGFVMLFAVTLSAILLSIALGVVNIALKEVRFSTNARDTNDAFFAADTGAECAFFNDKSTSNSFKDPGSDIVICFGSYISTTKSLSLLFWRFVIPSLGPQRQSCAIVTVDKTNSPLTTIISKGYNVGDGLCGSSNPNRVERELKVTY